jgi:hypothetical protein
MCSLRTVSDLSESDEALRAIEAAPARKRHPKVILAALHDLASPGVPRRLPRPMALRTATLPLARRSTRCWE